VLPLSAGQDRECANRIWIMLQRRSVPVLTSCETGETAGFSLRGRLVDHFGQFYWVHLYSTSIFEAGLRCFLARCHSLACIDIDRRNYRGNYKYRKRKTHFMGPHANLKCSACKKKTEDLNICKRKRLAHELAYQRPFCHLRFHAHVR
jgi:hypothetical protein